jgi:hypothetical protein
MDFYADEEPASLFSQRLPAFQEHYSRRERRIRANYNKV